jgi:hypothetical protein
LRRRSSNRDRRPKSDTPLSIDPDEGRRQAERRVNVAASACRKQACTEPVALTASTAATAAKVHVLLVLILVGVVWALYRVGRELLLAGAGRSNPKWRWIAPYTGDSAVTGLIPGRKQVWVRFVIRLLRGARGNTYNFLQNDPMQSTKPRGTKLGLAKSDSIWPL